MSNTIEVIGRNGCLYDAKHISGNLYIVGQHVVIVEDGYCQETVCRFTRANIAELTKRGRLVG